MFKLFKILVLTTALYLLICPVQATQKPNIIVIMTDDQDDMGSLTTMPNVQSDLIQSGVQFTNSFVTSPLCGPSRNSFLTGQYTHNHGAWNNGWAYQTFSAREDNSLGVWLQNAGYVTAIMGKFLNLFESATYVPPGWDRFITPIKGKNHGEYVYYGFTLNEDGVATYYPNSYITDTLRTRALQYIAARSKQPQPFFLLLTPIAPHFPTTPAVRHDHIFDALPLPMAPERKNFNEADVSDKSSIVRGTPSLTTQGVINLTSMFRNRRETLLAVDEMVGAIVDNLTATGAINHTVIVFTSDNGYAEGQHRHIGKLLPYEEDIRVPLIIRGPGIAHNTIRNQLVVNLDLPATILEWAGGVAGNPLDGRSLVPVLADPATPWRRAFAVEDMDSWGEETGARSTRLAYVRYSSDTHGVEEEVYNMASDKFQMQSNSQSIFLLGMRSLWERLKDCVGSTCWIQ